MSSGAVRVGEYRVIVEETVSAEVRVQARDARQALKLARDRYRAGQLVLEPGDLQDVRLCVLDADGQLGEWEPL